MSDTMTIEVYFDLICPWCLIGKRHLATALQRFRAAHPATAVHVVWRSAPLLPDTPPAGLPYDEFYERRLGGKAAVAARRAQVQAAAGMAGFQFNFDAIRTMPNTLAAHRLLRLAQDYGKPEQEDALLERLFAAYFLEGHDIGDATVLAGLARDCGLAMAIPGAASTPTEPRRAPPLSGVPCFVFNGRQAVSGAQPPEIMLATMQDSRVAV